MGLLLLFSTPTSTIQSQSRKEEAEEMEGEKRDTTKYGSCAVLRVLKTFSHPFGMDRQSLLQ